MDKKYKNIKPEELEKIVLLSDSYTDVVEKLGLDSKVGSSVKNIQRLIKRFNISIEHFTGIIQRRETVLRYNEENLKKIIEKHTSFKNVLEEMDLLPIQSNYKTLKKYLDKYQIDYSHIQSNKRILNKNYTESFFKEAVLKSTSLKDLYQNLDIIKQAGNYKTVKKYLKLYNIDITHFKKNENNSGKFKSIPINEILVENSTYNRGNSIKEKLYNEGLKQRNCEMCGQGEEWQGKHISLILDHKNGDHFDNKLENLQILCPNCNATLSTHGGKNMKGNKKYNYCKCGNIISNGAEMCMNCSKNKQRKVKERPSLETLLKLLNENTYYDVGRIYGVKDNTIRKWIKLYGVDPPKKNNIRSFRKVEERPSLEQLLSDLKDLSYIAVAQIYGVTDNCIRKWIRSYGVDPPRKQKIRKSKNML